MSRFTVGQEITPKETTRLLTRGRFYAIAEIDCGEAFVYNNQRQIHWVSDYYALTREEYEQAEREKDPFAPGKWVVCVVEGYGALPGEIIKTEKEHDTTSIGWFCSNLSNYPKSHFRPATPEEIKEQEMKIMDANRQTFTVGGREFYVGQTVWTTMNLGIGDKGTALAVVGCDLADKRAIIVRETDTVKAFSITADGRITTTEPKPHEWKFGDWARHPELGVVFIVAHLKDCDAVMVSNAGGWCSVDKSTLTYIATAEIPA